jgi:hypothetical protein
MKALVAGAVLLMTLAFSSCDTYVQRSYYDYYGNYCGSTPYAGCTYTYGGAKINIYNDPYYGMSNYYAGYGYCNFYDEYGCYYDPYWYSPSGVWYDAYGYAINSSDTNGGRDVLSDMADNEDAAIEKTGKAFAAKYALSEAKGVEIARSVREWEVFSKKQGRTADDYAQFSKRVFKVELKDAAAALASAKQGDMSKFEELNTQVARNWGTDAETSKKILRDWYKNELEAAGVSPSPRPSASPSPRVSATPS